MVPRKPLRLVSSAPWPELVEDLARKLNCSLDEASRVLSPPPPRIPKDAPWLPGLAPDGPR